MGAGNAPQTRATSAAETASQGSFSYAATSDADETPKGQLQIKLII